MSSRSAPRLLSRLALFGRVWQAYALARVGVARYPLPVVVERLADVHSRRVASDLPPRALGRFVWRRLRVGLWRPRCLFRALVLYRLLALSGTRSEIVIGLPERPTSQEAHAWVEVDGVDVGPPPGTNGHRELARYGR